MKRLLFFLTAVLLSMFSFAQYTYTVQLNKLSCPDWQSVYLYAWDDDQNQVLGAWPGQELQEPYSYTFTSSKPLNIIWNDYSGHQTVDIMNVSTTGLYSVVPPASDETKYTYLVSTDKEQCSYQLLLQDMYNYSWQGGKVKVTDGNVVMYFTLNYGESPKIVSLPWYGNNVTYNWVAGACCSYEAQITILTSGGQGLYKMPYNTAPTDNQLIYTLTESPCKTNPYHFDIKSVSQEDNNITIRWEQLTAASAYYVSVVYEDRVVVNNYLTDTTFTFTISNSGDYVATVRAVDDNDLQLCMTSYLFSATLPDIATANIFILVPSDCGMDVTNGLYMNWYTSKNDSIRVEQMTHIGGNVYTASINPDAPNYTYEFYAAGHYTSDYTTTDNQLCLEMSGFDLWDKKYHSVNIVSDCQLVDHDYRPYDMSVKTEKGVATFSFKYKDVPTGYCTICVMDEYNSGTYTTSFIPQAENEITYNFNNGDTLTYAYWYVEYNGSYYGVTGESFKVEPNPNVPYDIFVRDNGNRSFTFSWQCHNTPYQYYVSLYGSNNGNTYFSNQLSTNELTITLEELQGYYLSVYTYDNANTMLGNNIAYIDLSSSTQYDYEVYVYIPQAFVKSSTDSYTLCYHPYNYQPQYISLKAESNNWYSAKLTSPLSDLNVSILNNADPTLATINSLELYINSGTNYIMLQCEENGKYSTQYIYSDAYGHDYCPYNLSAEAGNGTVTFRWSVNEVAYSNLWYSIDGGDSYYSIWLDLAQREYTLNLGNTTDVTVDWYIYTYSFNVYGEPVQVKAAEMEQININVYVQPETEIALTSTLSFDIYDYGSGNSYTALATQSSTDERWYQLSLTTYGSVLSVAYNGYYMDVDSDTCIQIDYLNRVMPQLSRCDEIVQHDYRPINRQAVAAPGVVTFTWDAVTDADAYAVFISKDDWNTSTYQVVNGAKQLVWSVPEDYVGQILNWYVRAYSYDGSYTALTYGYLASETVTPIPAEYQLNSLISTSTDSINYQFSWKINKTAPQYEITLYDGNTYYYFHRDTVSTTSYNYKFFYTGFQGYYLWSIRPLSAANEVLAGYSYGDTIRVKHDIDPTPQDLQYTINDNTITFTWTTTSPQSKVHLFKTDADGDYVYIEESIVYNGTYSYQALEDGAYVIEVWASMPYQYVGQNDNGSYEIGDSKQQTATIFSGKTYNVQITAQEGGELFPTNPSGNYAEDFILYVEASPKTDYLFKGWSDGETASWRYIKITQDTTIIAQFEKITYCTVAVTAQEGGWVEGDIEGQFISGTTITISAYANTGYAFIGWSDGVTDSYRDIVLTQDTTLVAQFAPTYTITVAANTGGTVNTDINGSYVAGTELTLIATPNTGYRFTGWSDGVKTLNRIVVLSQDTIIYASFEEAGSTPQYTLTISASENGTVNSDVNGTYYEGDVIVIVATPAEGARFVGWSDGVNETYRELTISQDTSLVASFELITYTVTLKATEGGTVNSDEINDKPYLPGTELQLQANANKGYIFIGWSDGVTDNQRTYVVNDRDTVLTARFRALQSCILRIEVNNEKGGIVEANIADEGWRDRTGRKVEDLEGTRVQLRAVPNKGYRFRRWSDDETEAERTIVLKDEDLTITAYFAATTALDETQVSNAGIEKVLIDGTIYILRDGKLYTLTGVQVNNK